MASKKNDTNEAYNQHEAFFLPLLPLKNLIALPQSIIPIVVGRDISMRAVEFALKETREVFITAQKDPDIAIPGEDDVYKVGTRATILQVGRMESGALKILIEGISRARVTDFISTDEFMCVRAQEMLPRNVKSKVEEKALSRNLQQLFKTYLDLHERASKDVMAAINGLEDDLGCLIDTITMQLAQFSDLGLKERQKILETVSLRQRAMFLSGCLQDEIEILKTEQNIRERVQTQVEKHQKDYYLTEQMRAIQKELGRGDHQQEVAKMREKARKARMTDEAKEKVESECRRLEQMQPTSPEAAVSRNFIEWLISMPWYKKTKDNVTLEKSRSILDASHACMKKPKERIVEFLAAKKFAKDKMTKAPIICLAGPPGVGKTSLANSVAKALGRKMVRISLGGMRDEAEIRGHRRTYIGALPGKIAQAMKKAGVINPVIVLDEIDKMAMDFRGDPSSALLEVLDPEQNKAFIDHFLEVEYDLSKAMFITTANMVDAIPYPLLDRMEIIQLSGYTVPEKFSIATKFIVPKLLKEHGLRASQLKISDAIIHDIIEGYTREAGVRQLGQVIAKIMRKGIQVLLDEKGTKSVTVTPDLLKKWLGVARHRIEKRDQKPEIGIITGLAWTEVGGDTLDIEVSVLKGKGGLTLTGQLGDVMQESAQAALSYVRSRAKDLKITQKAFDDADIHIHLPEGSIPKDGPSAGITMTTLLASVFSGRAIKPGIAMTGEVTLRGRVLPVGGLKEKLLAADRYGMKTVIMPHKNKADVEEFIDELDVKCSVIFAKTMDEVLEHALEKKVAVTKKKTTKKK